MHKLLFRCLVILFCFFNTICFSQIDENCLLIETTPPSSPTSNDGEIKITLTCQSGVILLFLKSGEEIIPEENETFGDKKSYTFSNLSLENFRNEIKLKKMDNLSVQNSIKLNPNKKILNFKPQIIP